MVQTQHLVVGAFRNVLPENDVSRPLTCHPAGLAGFRPPVPQGQRRASAKLSHLTSELPLDILRTASYTAAMPRRESNIITKHSRATQRRIDGADLRRRVNQPDRDSKAEQAPTTAEAVAAGFNPEANRRHNERVNRLRTAMFDAIDAGTPQADARAWFFQLRKNPNLLCPWVLSHHIPAECWRCDMVKAGRADD